MAYTPTMDEQVRQIAVEHELAPGLVCIVCRCCWNRLVLRCLADVSCPNCGAIYVDVGFNCEP